MYKRILVPFDGSETSHLALAEAVKLARQSDGCVRILHVLDLLDWVSGNGYAPELVESARRQAERMLQEATGKYRDAAVPMEARLADLPGQLLGNAVAQQARAWQADLIAIGSHGRRGLARVVLGSGAEQIIRWAPVPVLVVRGGTPNATD